LDGCPDNWWSIVHYTAYDVPHEIIALDGIGNKPSFLKQLEMVLDGPDDEFVYFAEDDYLYRPKAVAKMLEFHEIMGSFITLYDHPDRYFRGDDRRFRDRIDVVAGCHWRTSESTTMTFGTQRWKLESVVHIMQEHACEGRKMWYPILDSKNSLWSPIPSLATHVQDGVLAPCVDWDKIWCGI